MSLNAATGGILIRSEKYGGIVGYCLHFKHSSEQKYKKLIDRCLEQEMFIALTWAQKQDSDHNMLFDITGRTARNKGFWAIIVAKKSEKSFDLRLGYGDTKRAAIQDAAFDYDRIYPFDVISTGYFDVSQEGAENFARHVAWGDLDY